MKKEALVGGLVGAAIIGGGAVKGGKKFKQEMSEPSVSSHDVILGNKSPKLPEHKVIPDAKTASGLVDSLYFEKTAYEYEEIKDKDEYKGYNKGDGSLVPTGVGALLLATYLANVAANKGNFISPLREAGRAAREVPKILIDKILRSGKAGKLGKHFADLLKKATKASGAKSSNIPRGGAYRASRASGQANKQSADPAMSTAQRALAGFTLGGSIGAANLGVHIIGDKHFENKRAIQRSYDSFPEMTKTYHKTLESTASDFIEDAFEKTARMGRFKSKKHFAKKLFKEDIAQNAVGSLPFFAIPDIASRLSDIGKTKYSVKKVGGADRIVIDIPMSDFKKQAAFGPRRYAKKVGARMHKSPTWKEFFKYELPSRSVRALSWAVPVAAISSVSKRANKLSGNSSSENKPLEPGKARVTIETAPQQQQRTGPGYTFDPKYASENIDSLYKTAIALKANNVSGVKKNVKRV